MVAIKQQIANNTRVVSSGTNTRNYITIHETANTSRGAGAQSHANLQSRGNSRSASWHFQVDDKLAIQSFLETKICWHAGSGAGNRNSIGIEICVNSDGNFREAVENAAELTAYLMKKHGIPINRVVQHHYWSGKNCPTFLRSGSRGITWTQFISMVRSAYAGSGSVAHASSPSSPSPSSQDYDMDYGKFRYGVMLQSGMGGAAVRRYQEDMNKLGYKIAVDGIFGIGSETAAKQFQRANGLVVDGYVGEATQKKMTELLTVPKPTPITTKPAPLAVKQTSNTGVRYLNPSTVTFKNEVYYALQKARKKGILESDKWERLFRDKNELTVDDAIALLYTIWNRTNDFDKI